MSPLLQSASFEMHNLISHFTCRSRNASNILFIYHPFLLIHCPSVSSCIASSSPLLVHGLFAKVFLPLRCASTIHSFHLFSLEGYSILELHNLIPSRGITGLVSTYLCNPYYRVLCSYPFRLSLSPLCPLNK